MAQASLWWVGLLLDAFATLAGAGGKILLRHAAVSKNSWFYPLGLCLTAVIDPIFDLMAYSYTAQSIIAACAGLVVVWNVLLAPCLLGEVLTYSRKCGAALICIGTVCVGAFGNHTEVERTPAEYLELFARPAALAYYGGYALWTVFALSAYCFSGPTMSAFYLCAFGGSLAGNSFTTKAAVELSECGIDVAGCDDVTNPFESPLFYAFAGVSLTTATLSLTLLAISLRGYAALYMITVYQGFFVLSGALSGNFVMDERNGQSSEALGAYAGSIGVVLLGLYVLTKGELDALEQRNRSAMW